MSTIEIVTERLSLRPFRVDDLEALVAYRSDPEVPRYQSWDGTYSMADAESFLSSQRELVFGQPGEWLELAIVDRESGTVCGDCAVRVATDHPATAEVGVTLAQVGQGKGLATEALTAVLTELFEQRGMHRVFAEADDRNVPVRRLFERLGFGCEARLVEADCSRVSGRRCASTRCWSGSGASTRMRSGNNAHRLLVTVRLGGSVCLGPTPAWLSPCRV